MRAAQRAKAMGVPVEVVADSATSTTSSAPLETSLKASDSAVVAEEEVEVEAVLELAEGPLLKRRSCLNFRKPHPGASENWKSLAEKPATPAAVPVPKRAASQSPAKLVAAMGKSFSLRDSSEFKLPALPAKVKVKRSKIRAKAAPAVVER